MSNGDSVVYVYGLNNMPAVGHIHLPGLSITSVSYCSWANSGGQNFTISQTIAHQPGHKAWHITRCTLKLIFCFVCLNHINIPVQHMQAISGQTEAC